MKLKKLITIGVAITTIVWTLGLAVAIPAVNATAPATGSLIKASGPATYYYASDGKRYVFVNEKTYKTWYSDFSGITTLTDAELAAIPIGGNVTYKPGVKMVKITTDPKVYAVDAHGTLRWVNSEAIAVALYGTGWNRMIEDLSDAFFINYTVGAEITSAASFVPATVTAAATSINTNLSLGTVATGGALTVSLGADTPTAVTIPKSASGVEVLKFNLSAGSTAATVNEIIIHQVGVGAVADFSNVYLYDGATRLTNGRSISSADRTVDFASLSVLVPANTTKTLTIKVDVAASPTAGDIHVFEVASASAVISDGTVSGSFPVRGNSINIGSQSVSTVTVTKGTTPANPTLSQPNSTISEFKVAAGSNDVEVRGVSLINTGGVSSSNITDLSLYAGDVQVATATTMTGDHMVFTLSTPYVIPQGVTRIFQVKATISGRSGSTYTVKTYLEYASDLVVYDRIYNVGAYVDDASAGTGEGTFGGATDEFITVTVIGGKVNVAFIGPAKSDISKGTQNVHLYDLSLNSTQGAVEVKKLSFTIAGTTTGHVKGNPASGTGNNTFTSVKVIDTDSGRTVMGPAEYSVDNAATTTGAIVFTDAFTMAAGATKHLSLVVNIRNTEDASSDFIDKGYTATLNAFDATSVRDVATNQYLATTDIVPSAANTGNALTIKSSSLTVTRSSTPTSTSVVKRTANVEALGLSFAAGQQSKAVVSAITLTGYGQAASAGDYTVANFDSIVSSVTLWDASVSPAVQVGTAVSPSSGVLSFTNLNWTINAGTTKRLVAKVNALSTAAAGDTDGSHPDKYYITVYGTDITATDKDSNTISLTDTHHNGDKADTDASSASVIDSVYAVGGLSVAIDPGTPSADIVVAGATAQIMSKFKFAATKEAFTISKVRILNNETNGTASATTDRSVTAVTISYPTFESGVAGTATDTGYLSAGSVQFSNMNMYVPKDGIAVLTVKADLNTIAGGATSGDAPRLDLDNYQASDTGYFAAAGVGSGTAKYYVGSDDIDGNAMYVRKTKPTITKQTSTTTLDNGVQDLLKFSVAADAAGTVTVKGMTFAVTTFDDSGSGLNLDTLTITDAAHTSNPAWGTNYVIVGASNNNLKIPYVADPASGTNLAAANSTKYVYVMFNAGYSVNIDAGTSKTFILRGTVSGAAANDSISTKITNTNGTAEAADTGVLKAATTVTSFNVVTNATLNDFFVWSDRSSGEATWSDAIDGSADWTNGYLAEQLPVDVQTVSR